MLSVKHAFGCKGAVATPVQFINDSTVAFVVGQAVALHSLESNTQRFLHGTSQEGISAIALSPSARFLAVAEKTSDRPRIGIYDVSNLKRRKDLEKAEMATRSFVSLAFSCDGKILAALGAQPSFPLVLYQWEKNRIACSINALAAQPEYVPQVLFHPQDPTLVSVVGQNCLKLFRHAESSLKQQASPVGKRDPQSFICATWIVEDRDRLVAASEGGELVLIENNEVKSTMQGHSDGLQIQSIVSFSKGFVCGVDQGSVLVYEREADSDREPFRKTRSLSVEALPAAITGLSASPSEEILAAVTRNNQLLSFPLSSAEINKPEESQQHLKPLTQPFHCAGVSGVDACIRKPWVATCGHDRSVRVWNYDERTCELYKFWPEEAFSIALHPSGFMVLVGFADKLRLMNVLMEDIVVFKEFGIKACKECNFSNGGQFFAAVNSNTIQLYNTYTCENIGNLRGHNGKVRSVHWMADDSRIVSAGMDGAVYQWRLDTLKRESENVLKGCDYKCVVSSPNGRSIYAVGSDKKLKEIVEGQVNDEHESDAIITQLAMPSTARVLLAGTEHGCIRVYKLPLTGEYTETFAHSSQITRLRVSFDDREVFSTGDDSLLLTHELRGKDSTTGSRRGDRESVAQTDEVLVTKTEIEEKRARMQELEQQVNELQSHNEYQLRLRDMNHNEKVKEITDKYQSEVEAERQKFEKLLEDKNNQEMEYEEKKRQIEEQYKQQLENNENEYSQKIMAEVERYQQLQKEKEKLNDQWEEKVALLQESHKKTIDSLTEDYEKQLEEERQTCSRLQEEKDEAQRVFDETKRQLEEDADREIEELKERYEHQLGQEREASLRLKGENGIMKKKFNDMKKEIEDQKDEISKQHEEKRKLESEKDNLHKDIKSLKKEIGERDDTISDKEKRIYDLKKKNQELEKFKFVLDYKIKELKKQIDPKDSEIAEMKNQVRDMDNELQRYHKDNSSLDLTISDLKLRLDGVQKENLKQRQLNADKHNAIERFQHDLQEAAQNLQNPAKLKESVKTLYNKHFVEGTQREQVSEDIQKEYKRQREYLEKTVESLKHKLQKDEEMHRQENSKSVEENSQLLTEINELRRENKALREREKAASQEFDGLSRVSGNSSNAVPKRRASTNTGATKQQQLPRSRRNHEHDDQYSELMHLKQELERKDKRIEELEGLLERVNTQRPASAERLPPMEGFNE